MGVNIIAYFDVRRRGHFRLNHRNFIAVVIAGGGLFTIAAWSALINE